MAPQRPSVLLRLSPRTVMTTMPRSPPGVGTEDVRKEAGGADGAGFLNTVEREAHGRRCALPVVQMPRAVEPALFRPHCVLDLGRRLTGFGVCVATDRATMF